MPETLRIRPAVPNDLDALRDIMARAIDRLQCAFLSPAQVAASRLVMGLDTQLIEDRTYFVAEQDGGIVGCGGWSFRATLYGGDHGVVLRDASPLRPEVDAARIRAMYTHPDHARRGVAAHILAACEEAAAAAGFTRTELMATLSGEPFYLARGYRLVRRVEAPAVGEIVPLCTCARTSWARLLAGGNRRENAASLEA